MYVTEREYVCAGCGRSICVGIDVEKLTPERCSACRRAIGAVDRVLLSVLHSHAASDFTAEPGAKNAR